MDERARILLTEIVRRHIADGNPIGARTLSRESKLKLSTASISNLMADLEEEGLLVSPRSSAGRVPTAKGYQYFVDSRLSMKVSEESPTVFRDGAEFGNLIPNEPKRIAEQVAEMLSCTSHFVGVVAISRQDDVFCHIDFLALDARRVLIIVVSHNGSVENRVIVTPRGFSQSELVHASSILNSQYAGRPLDQVWMQLKSELAEMSEEVRGLMIAVLADSQLSASSADDLVIAGRKNLFDLYELTSDIPTLRRLFDLFEEKSELMRLMECSDHANRVGVFIGGATGDERYRDLSIISAPFFSEGKPVGLLGVIGPTRMPYDMLISLVDRASQLVENKMTKFNRN